MDFEEKERFEQKEVYEKYDFPIIHQGRIDWHYCKDDTDIRQRIEQGIYLNEDKVENFLEDFEKLKETHDYEDAYLTWAKDGDRGTALKTIYAHGGKGLWLELNFDDFFYLGSHNVDYNYQCLFFVECLAEYLKYSGIEFPYVKAEVRDIIEKKGFLYFENGEEIYHTYNVKQLDYSFVLPFESEFDDFMNVVGKFSNELGYEDLVITKEDGVFINGELCASFSENTKGEEIIVSEKIKDQNKALNLFYLLSMPLKKKLFV